MKQGRSLDRDEFVYMIKVTMKDTIMRTLRKQERLNESIAQKINIANGVITEYTQNKPVGHKRSIVSRRVYKGKITKKLTGRVNSKLSRNPSVLFHNDKTQSRYQLVSGVERVDYKDQLESRTTISLGPTLSRARRASIDGYSVIPTEPITETETLLQNRPLGKRRSFVEISKDTHITAPIVESKDTVVFSGSMIKPQKAVSHILGCPLALKSVDPDSEQLPISMCICPPSLRKSGCKRGSLSRSGSMPSLSPKGMMSFYYLLCISIDTLGCIFKK